MTADDPFVEELRSRRLALGMAAAQLSQALHYNRNAVSRWENGLRNPSPEARKAWAEALDYDPDDELGPDVDEVRVYRACLGDRMGGTLNKREREIVVARLSPTKSAAEIARILGVSRRQVHRDKYPNGRKEEGTT